MKTICVPINKRALSRLDYGQNVPGDLIEIILSDDDFYKLREKGFFDNINVLIDSMIDDFEDEHILDTSQLSKVINSRVFERGSHNEALFKVVVEIKRLFDEAMKRKTGVHFYF